MKRVALALLVLAGLAAAGAGGAWLWLERELSAVASPPEVGREVAYTVESGDSFWGVAAELEREGVIRNARVARWFAQSENLASKLKTGEYRLSTAQSTPEIFDALTKGRVETHPVVIPEGFRATEIAARLEAAGLAEADRFLTIVFDPESPGRFGVEGPTLEGYLFPDTYRFARGVPEERIVRAMVDQFLAVRGEILAGAEDFALTMREHATLASIVEKETGAAHERPLIAAVFLNRLERKMKLQTDPTVIYGIKDFDGNIKRIHLEDASNPYNTYRIRGLPPGPIASAGRDALRAVVEPADTPYLFFVSKNDGTHVFARTNAEHERNVDEYQRRRRRR
ncbi:MAG: endolytic transglycosylase MltG [Myxococcota bacterium]